MISKETYLNNIYNYAFEDELNKQAGALGYLKGSFGALKEIGHSQGVINASKKGISEGSEKLRIIAPKVRNSNAAAEMLENAPVHGANKLDMLTGAQAERHAASGHLQQIKDVAQTMRGNKATLEYGRYARGEAIKKALPAVGIIGATGLVGATGIGALNRKPVEVNQISR